MYRFTGTDVVASVNYRGNGYVCRWQGVSGGLYKQIALSSSFPAAITGLDVSPSGEMLGLANAEGHSMLIHSQTLSVRQRNKKAHMVFGTDAAFAPHGQAFLSVSGDASARVNLVPLPRSLIGPIFWLFIMLFVALIVLALLDDTGLLPAEVSESVSPIIRLLRASLGSTAEGIQYRIEGMMQPRPIS